MITSTLLAECRDLALRCAPELGNNLYVLNHPATIPEPPSTYAYAACGPCVLLQDHLESVGLWRGPGPSIVFVDASLPRAAALTVLAHEVAHILPYKPVADVEPTDENRIKCRTAVIAWNANPTNTAQDRPLWCPDHPKEFLRIALHLWWRMAIVGGEALPLDPLCAGYTYDLSPAYSYWTALGNEPLRMRDATFAEILATEPPAAFRAWWLSDLENWMKRNPNHVEKVRGQA